MVDTPQFLIYTDSRYRCPYCLKAKYALTSNSYTFEERDIADPIIRDELLAKRSTAHTVPQIFLASGDVHIGGCDDLLRLIREDSLDIMIEMNQ